MKFIAIYYDNIGKQNAEAIENSVLGQVITKFLNDLSTTDIYRDSSWNGTTTELLEKLNGIAVENSINTNSKGWPKAANSLTKKLKIIQSNIREGLGFDISITRITTGEHKGVSVSSPSSPSSPGQNQARNEGLNGEGTIDGEDSNPHQANESSPKNPKNGENRAQNNGGEGSEGSEGIYRTLTGATTSTNSLIYRIGQTDTFACHSCRQKGDRWFMGQHGCSSRDKGKGETPR